MTRNGVCGNKSGNSKPPLPPPIECVNPHVPPSATVPAATKPTVVASPTSTTTPRTTTTTMPVTDEYSRLMDEEYAEHIDVLTVGLSYEM